MRKALILAGSILLLSNLYAQNNNSFVHPGGVVLKEISYKQHMKGFQYNGSKVATMEKNGS